MPQLKGYKQTPEHTAKIAESNRNRSQETKERVARIIAFHNSNRTWSSESRQKMSKSKQGTVISNEQRKLISIAMKARKLTDEHKKKISLSHIGKKKSLEHVQKMSEAQKGKWAGDKNPKWKGGIPDAYFTTQYNIRKSKAEGLHTITEWALLKEEYYHTCPSCGRQEPEIKLTKDHIIPLSKGGSNFISNIQPLCRKCNSKKKIDTIIYKIPIKEGICLNL